MYAGYLAALDDHFRRQTLPYAQLHMYGQQTSTMLQVRGNWFSNGSRNLNQFIRRVIVDAVLLESSLTVAIKCIRLWGFACSHCFLAKGSKSIAIVIFDFGLQPPSKASSACESWGRALFLPKRGHGGIWFKFTWTWDVPYWLKRIRDERSLAFQKPSSICWEDMCRAKLMGPRTDLQRVTEKPLFVQNWRYT